VAAGAVQVLAALLGMAAGATLGSSAYPDPDTRRAQPPTRRPMG